MGHGKVKEPIRRKKHFNEEREYHKRNGMPKCSKGTKKGEIYVKSNTRSSMRRTEQTQGGTPRKTSLKNKIDCIRIEK